MDSSVSEPTLSPDVRYRRILLKLSGEALMGEDKYGVDPDTVNRIAQEIATVHALGVQIALVVGGGNIFRGTSGAADGMERATADYMACWPPSLTPCPCKTPWKRWA